MLVSANDSSRFVLVTVAVAGGFVGVGLAVGVAVLNKDTEAYLGANSVVNAQARRIADQQHDPGRHVQLDEPEVQHARHVQRPRGRGRFERGRLRARAGRRRWLRRRRRRCRCHRHERQHSGLRRPELADQPRRGRGRKLSRSTSPRSTTSSRSPSPAVSRAASSASQAASTSASPTRARRRTSARARPCTRRLDVEVFGLSRKEVQTYALSASGGFVGVALAVSVWSVGTQTNSNYQDSGSAGPDKGTWSASGSYNAGDVVTGSDGKRYTARCDIGGTWQSSTKYNKCRILTDGGSQYQALVDNPNQGLASCSKRGPVGALHPDRPERRPGELGRPDRRAPFARTGHRPAAPAAPTGRRPGRPRRRRGLVGIRDGVQRRRQGRQDHDFKARVTSATSTIETTNTDSTRGTFRRVGRRRPAATRAPSTARRRPPRSTLG